MAGVGVVWKRVRERERAHRFHGRTDELRADFEDHRQKAKDGAPADLRASPTTSHERAGRGDSVHARERRQAQYTATGGRLLCVAIVWPWPRELNCAWRAVQKAHRRQLASHLSFFRLLLGFFLFEILLLDVDR